jgi:predicted nucleic acid-binding protein
MRQVITDTNVVLRFLIEDDKTFPKLLSYYRMSKELIFDRLMKIVLNPRVMAEKELLTKMLVTFNNYPKLSMVDCYLVVMAENKNLRVVTFDEDLMKVLEKLK